MLIPQLETERLILRAFTESDLDAYAEMCSDPEVIEKLEGTTEIFGSEAVIYGISRENWHCKIYKLHPNKTV